MRGATDSGRYGVRHHPNFNPRTPCGVRLTYNELGYKDYLFQSTHPMRGATLSILDSDISRIISIHAPHAGCDSMNLLKRCNRIIFQSTHPMRGATKGTLRLLCLVDKISIHAPHAGCDAGSCRKGKRHRNFNPRTPCGVRLYMARMKSHMPM